MHSWLRTTSQFRFVERQRDGEQSWIPIEAGLQKINDAPSDHLVHGRTPKKKRLENACTGWYI